MAENENQPQGQFSTEEVFSKLEGVIQQLKAAVAGCQGGASTSQTPLVSDRRSLILRELLETPANGKKKTVKNKEAGNKSSEKRGTPGRPVKQDFEVTKTVLLLDPTSTAPPAKMSTAYKEKRVLDGLVLQRSMTEEEVQQYIKSQYKEINFPHLQYLEEITFEFMKLEDDSLVVPSLCSDSKFDGNGVFKNFYRKRMFLRPNKLLQSDDIPAEAIPSPNRNQQTCHTSASSQILELSETERTVQPSQTFAPSYTSTFLETFENSTQDIFETPSDSISVLTDAAAASTPQTFSSATEIFQSLSQITNSYDFPTPSQTFAPSNTSTLPETLRNSTQVETLSDSNFVPTDAAASTPQTFSSAKEALQCLRATLTYGAQMDWKINRRRILQSTFNKMRQKSFIPTRYLKISFIDSYGATVEQMHDKKHRFEEEGHDAGGLTREFFTLSMKAIKASRMFAGSDEDRLVLNYYAPAYQLEEQKCDYQLAGELIAMALVMGGSGPNFFSEYLYDAIIDEKYAHPTHENVAEADVSEVLRKFIETDSLAEAQQLLLSREMQSAGLQSRISRLEEKNRVYQQAVHYYAVEKTKPLLQKFMKGLELYGLLSLIRNNPAIFKNIFIKHETPFLPKDFERIFQIQMVEPGNSKHDVECEVYDWWMDFLTDCHDGMATDVVMLPDDTILEVKTTLEDVLFFATGCRREPPLGFDTSPKIFFNHDFFEHKKFPIANTCVISLYLPVVHKSYASFKKTMMFAIQNSRGFGFA